MPRFPAVFYEEFDPAPDLSAHVAHYWHMTVGPEVTPGFGHTIYPNGCVSLACLLRPSGEGRVAIVGPRADAFTVPVVPGDRYWGITFWPDAGGLCLGVPARSLAGIVGDAVPILGPRDGDALLAGLRGCDTRAEAGGVIDRVVEPRVAAASGLDPAVRAAVVGLVASRGEVAIAELAGGLGVSPRQLQRRFGEAVGLSPKQFARIRRFRSAISEALSPNPRTWSAVAAELGYADQSHLVREFVQLAGRPPAAVARGIRAITHGRVTP
jgi:AraC-like DNA-binding protein